MTTAKAIDWNILKHNGLFHAEGGAGSTARLPVLLCLIGYSNIRNRCWPTLDTIMSGVGISDKEVVSAAIAWLEEHGAIYKVSVEKRVGNEAEVSPENTVYELTGMIKIGNETVLYFPVGE